MQNDGESTIVSAASYSTAIHAIQTTLIGTETAATAATAATAIDVGRIPANVAADETPRHSLSSMAVGESRTVIRRESTNKKNVSHVDRTSPWAREYLLPVSHL